MQESQALGVCGSAALIMSERTERNRATGKMQVTQRQQAALYSQKKNDEEAGTSRGSGPRRCGQVGEIITRADKTRKTRMSDGETRSASPGPCGQATSSLVGSAGRQERRSFCPPSAPQCPPSCSASVV
ncbi:hypothetical protein VTI28DRAFT_7055 [Corynascus sepedonium]